MKAEADGYLALDKYPYISTEMALKMPLFLGLYKRSDLQSTKNLKALFKDIRNLLSQKAKGVVRDEYVAQQVMNLLFCKIYDEINTAPDEMVEFRSGINESDLDVSKRIKNLFSKVKEKYNDIFSKNDSIDLDNSSINYVVGELQNYCIIEAERDVLGDAFEVFIGDALKGGQGQFFTPRNIVKLAINILDPDSHDMIIDPACGSGGFLIVAVEHVWAKIKQAAQKRGLKEDWIKEKQEEIANRCFRGIDKDSFLTKVTKAYMAIIGDGRGGIFCENTLDLYDNWENKTKDKIALGSFSVLLTNPPFGSKIPVKEKNILEQFSLAHIWKKKEKGQRWEESPKISAKMPPQILFIERCLDLLKPNGKMAIVLPDGVLGGSKLGYIANYIRDKAKVLALIDLPKETFQPFVSTKTHLVFLEKKDKEQAKESANDIFMGIVDYVGHDSKGRPVFKQNENGERKIQDDLPKVLAQYLLFKQNKLTKKYFNDYGFVVSSQWIENNLIARRYLPKYIEAIEELFTMKRDKVADLMTIGEIKDKLFTGANISAEEYLNISPYKYIMTDCVTDFGMNPSNIKYITEKSYNGNISKAVKTGQIVINRAGNPGRAIIIPEDMQGILSCGFVFVLKVKKGINPYYITAFLNSRLGRMQMERLSFGSILSHITKDDLENVIIPFLKDNKKESAIINQFEHVTELQMQARIAFESVKEEFEEI